jgi:hypothetical protein
LSGSTVGSVTSPGEARAGVARTARTDVDGRTAETGVREVTAEIARGLLERLLRSGHRRDEFQADGAALDLRHDRHRAEVAGVEAHRQDVGAVGAPP